MSKGISRNSPKNETCMSKHFYPQRAILILIQAIYILHKVINEYARVIVLTVNYI